MILIGVGLVVFVAVSALLARAWSADGSERSAITQLIEDEAHGDQVAMLASLKDCGRSRSCRSRVAGDVAALRHPGRVSILQLQPSTSFSLSGSTGTARVAWDVASSRPIVQCVRVQRSGDVIRGLRVELLAISPRIATEGNCPASF